MSVHEPRRRSPGWSRAGGRELGKGERRAGAGLRRLKPPETCLALLRLYCRRLSDRPARVRVAPVGLEALPVGPPDPPSLWRGHRGGPARVPASVSAAPALPASCLPPLHPRFCLAGFPGGRRTRGHPRPNAFREAVDFPRAVAWVRLSASAGQGSGAQTPTPLPGAVWWGYCPCVWGDRCLAPADRPVPVS